MGRQLKRLFDKLVKYKMGAAALPVAGISIGLCLVETHRLTPPPFDWWIGTISVVLVAASTFLFLSQSSFIWWLRREAAGRDKRKFGVVHQSIRRA
jgi:hypothetical protein